MWASEHQLHPGITSDHDLPSHVSNSWWFSGNWRRIWFSSSKAPMGAQRHWEVMLLMQNCRLMGTWRAIRAALSSGGIQRRMFQQCLRLRGATYVVLLNPFLKHIQERGTSSGQENWGHILLSDPCDGLCGFLGSSRTGQSETGISGAGLEQRQVVTWTDPKYESTCLFPCFST